MGLSNLSERGHSFTESDFAPAKISSFQVKYKASKKMSLGMTLHGPLSLLLPHCGPS